MTGMFSMSAVILAGGKSSRMGLDKAFLRFGGETILETLVHLANSLFRQTLVIVNEGKQLSGLDLGTAEIHEDLIREGGPLAAVYTALTYSKELASCVFTCDMPFIDESLIRELVSFWEGDFDVVCFEVSDGSDQPFPGIYRRRSRSLVRSLLDRGENSMKQFLRVASVKPIVFKQERIEFLANINDREDYDQALARKERLA